MENKGHIHVIPVDPSLSAKEAWKELCIFGFRATFTGKPKWAVLSCDGEECRNIQENVVVERPWEQV